MMLQWHYPIPLPLLSLLPWRMVKAEEEPAHTVRGTKWDKAVLPDRVAGGQTIGDLLPHVWDQRGVCRIERVGRKDGSVECLQARERIASK